MKAPRLQDVRKAIPIAREDWDQDAACKDTDPEVFFPEDLPSRNRADKLYQQQVTLTALATCGRCPVRELCLDFGLDEEWGIWGGTLPSQRQKLRNYTRKGNNN